MEDPLRRMQNLYDIYLAEHHSTYSWMKYLIWADKLRVKLVDLHTNVSNLKERSHVSSRPASGLESLFNKLPAERIFEDTI